MVVTRCLVFRLEERDKELQTTYGNLRQRYGDLFRAHVELMERTRIANSDDVHDADNVPTSSSRHKISAAAELAACTSTTGIGSPLLLISHKGDSPYDWGWFPFL